MGIEIKIQNNNIQKVLKEANDEMIKRLTVCGMKAKDFAKEKLTDELNKTTPQWYVRTGALRNSIDYIVDPDEKKMIVGAGAEYAPYVEFGTGINYDGGGRRTSWVYKGSDGQFHMTNGMKARPFIKPALEDHMDFYEKVLKEG